MKTLELDLAILELGGDPKAQMDVLLCHDGVTDYRDGTRLLVDAQAEATVVKRFAEHGAKIPFDINHATTRKAPKGEPADAYGWGTKLWREPGVGLKCRVEWTDEGLAHIKSKRYRYLSPVLVYDEQSGRVHEVHSVALTTKPATPRMPALAATAGIPTEKKHMDGSEKLLVLQDVLAKSGVTMADDADGDAVLVAAAERIKAQDTEIKEFRFKELIAPHQARGAVGGKDDQDHLRRVYLTLGAEELQMVLNPRKGVPQGRTTGFPEPNKGDRATVIRTAINDFQANPQHEKMTSCKAFVADALREKNMAALSDDEIKAHSIG